LTGAVALALGRAAHLSEDEDCPRGAATETGCKIISSDRCSLCSAKGDARRRHSVLDDRRHPLPSLDLKTAVFVRCSSARTFKKGDAPRTSRVLMTVQ
jgi:hypothetical protein